MNDIMLSKYNHRKILTISYGKIYALAMACIPLFFSIRFPFTQISISQIIIVLFTILSAFKLLGKSVFLKNIVFVYIFFGWFLYRCEGNYIHYILYALICIINILAFYYRIVNLKTFFSIIYYVSMFASILVILQTIVYYLFNVHIQMMYPSWAVRDIGIGYKYYWTYGCYIGSNTYRPSAFFFEPSQFCQYSFIGLAFSIYQYVKQRKKITGSIIVTLGIVLSTSSQGFLFAIGCWMWGIFIRGDKKIIKRMLCTIVIGVILVGLIYIFYVTGFFKVDYILGRVFGKVGGYNAIEGRNFATQLYLRQLSGKSILIGKGLINNPDVYLVCAVSYLYTIGLIGLVLFVTMIIFSIRSLFDISSVIAVAFIGLSFIAETNQLLFLVFFLPIAYSMTSLHLFHNR